MGLQAVAVMQLGSDVTLSIYAVRSRDCGICETALCAVAGLQHVIPLHLSCFLLNTCHGWKQEPEFLTMTQMQHALG